MDSGARASIIHDPFVRTNKFNTRITSANMWSKMAGSLSALCEAEVKMKLPELNVTAYIFAPFHITSKKSNYNVMFGWNLRQELGLTLDFQKNFVGWKGSKIAMKSINCKIKSIKSTTNRIKKILDAKYVQI